jgi:hypothetical protein
VLKLLQKGLGYRYSFLLSSQCLNFESWYSNPPSRRSNCISHSLAKYLPSVVAISKFLMTLPTRPFPPSSIPIDVERQPFVVTNPYNNTNGSPATPPNMSQKVFDRLYRVVVMCGSLYFLHTWTVYATVLRSPKIRHEWLKVGLAASIGK